jgi:Lon protease-like protein
VHTTLDHSALAAACPVMPLFPLPGAVFLPNTLLPLHVFEHRYRDLIADVTEGDGYLAVPRLKPGWEANYGGNPPLFSVAGFGKIIRRQLLPDGRSNVVILGLGRIRVDGEVATDTAYRVAKGKLLEDRMPDGRHQAIQVDVDRLRVMVGQAFGNKPGIAERMSRLISHQTESVAFINGLAHLVLPDVDARQTFLEIDHVSDRIEHLQGLLVNTMFDDELRA